MRHNKVLSLFRFWFNSFYFYHKHNRYKLLLFALVLILLAGGSLLLGQPLARAATYEVGPGKPYAQLSQVAGLLQPGDLVLVYANGATPYRGVRFTKPATSAAPITIRGVRDSNGRRPLISDQNVVSGVPNIVLSFEGGHYIFEGFEVTTTGASSSGGPVINIHPWRGPDTTTRDIAIRDTYLHDCPSHGILSNDSSSGSILLSYVEITRCGFGTYDHSIYLTTGNEIPALANSVVQIEHSYIHASNGGNSLKLRSKFNKIYYNWIETAPTSVAGSETFYGLQMIGPDDGTGGSPSNPRNSEVVGNVLVQNNSYSAVQIGGDGTGMSYGQYRFVNNTFLLNGAGRQAIRLRYQIRSLELENNIFANRVNNGITVLVEQDSPNWGSNPRPLAGRANWVAAGSSVPPELQATLIGTNNDPGFENLASYNLRLKPGSLPLNKGTTTAASPAGNSFPTAFFLPTFEPAVQMVKPLNQATPRLTDTLIDIGAYETIVIAPPTLSLSFNPNTFRANSTTRLTYTLTNPNNSSLSGLTFSHNLPIQLKVAANPAISNNCNLPGTVTATVSSSTVNVSGVGLTANQTCTISLSITSAVAGSYTTTTGVVSTTESGAGTNTSNSANVTVTPLLPTLSLVATPTVIVVGSVTTFTYTLTNPNNSTALSGLVFTDTLPTQLFVSQTPAVANSCGGTVTATPLGGLVQLANGNLAAGVSCQVSVNISSQQPGTWTNSVESLSSTESGIGFSGVPQLQLQVVTPLYQAFPIGNGNIIRVGAANLGVSRATTLTVSNIGHPITSLGVAFSLSGSSSSIFTIAQTNLTLTGGQSQEIRISCTPTATGLVSATLLVQTTPNALASAPSEYTLQCWGADRVVTKNIDDGSSGTLSEALTAGNAGDVIIFDLPANNKVITFNQPVTLIAKSGMVIDAGCAAGPNVIINGNGQLGVGLRLVGNNYVYGLQIQGFSNQQLVGGSNNSVGCLVARH